MKFSLIVPTTGNVESLEALFSSFQKLAEIDESEIVLIVNPPDNLTQEISSRFKQDNLRIMTSEKGVNNARNVGLAQSRGEILFFFDDDCVVLDPFHLKKHEILHDQNPDILGFGGEYFDPRTGAIEKLYCRLQNQWLNINFDPISNHSYTLLGGNFSLKKELLDQLKFDSTIEYGGSETEFFLRLSKMGKKFQKVPIPVGHFPSLNEDLFLKKMSQQAFRHQDFVSSGLMPTLHFVPNKSAAPSVLEKKYHQAFNSKSEKKPSKIFTEFLGKSFVEFSTFFYFYRKYKNIFLSLDKIDPSVSKKNSNSL